MWVTHGQTGCSPKARGGVKTNDFWAELRNRNVDHWNHITCKGLGKLSPLGMERWLFLCYSNWNTYRNTRRFKLWLPHRDMGLSKVALQVASDGYGICPLTDCDLDFVILYMEFVRRVFSDTTKAIATHARS